MLEDCFSCPYDTGDMFMFASCLCPGKGKSLYAWVQEQSDVRPVLLTFILSESQHMMSIASLGRSRIRDKVRGVAGVCLTMRR